MKTSTLTLRIEEDLREKFSAAAEKNHRPAAQLIRDFMRDYIAQNDAVAVFPRISEAERAWRKYNDIQAKAIVELEGFKPDTEDDANIARYLDGELNSSELAELTLASIKQQYEIH